MKRVGSAELMHEGFIVRLEGLDLLSGDREAPNHVAIFRLRPSLRERVKDVVVIC